MGTVTHTSYPSRWNTSLGRTADHDDDITGGAAVGTGIAHAAQCKALVVVDAHGDGHLQRLFGSHLAAAVADLAGVLYQLALAAAAGAGLLGLHHAKGGALLADDKAASAAVRAGLGAAAGGAAGAVALSALLLTGDGDVLLAAVHGLVKAQGDAHPDVLTLAGGVGVSLTGRAAEAAKAAAEDIAKNVAQIHAVAAKTAKPPDRGRRRSVLHRWGQHRQSRTGRTAGASSGPKAPRLLR